ncbi:MAG: DUF2085 domain-containing protein [Anaerolineales bacterium]|nr:DUF2085 domain-containing protein [Anaerolineales bacterium]MCX7608808.1 DUF2085 domain-containing protein [Anaerolineales bacterium]MDW8278860.1 DUF2085 domain-containing protein [Anaerolineales bacterium]
MPSPKRLVSLARYLIIPAGLIVITIWLLNTPPGLLGKLDGIGYAVCHRIPERSFHVEGRPLPLCARCSGMYLGAMIALIYQSIVSPYHQKFPRWPIAIPLILFAVAFGIDGANSYLYLIKSVSSGPLTQIPNLYIPNNTLRLFTGAGMGLGLSALLYPAFNQTVWNQPDDRPALTWKDLITLVGLIVIVNLLILTESPLILYPAAFVSAGGVVVLLTMVYTIVWIMLMGEENRFVHLRQLWLALLAGLTIAWLQILLIDLFRFWLTGTWGPIPLS